MNKIKELAKIRDVKLAMLSVGDKIECINLLSRYPRYYNGVYKKYYFEYEQVYKITKNNIYTTWTRIDKMDEFSICVKIPKTQIRLNKHTGNLYYSAQRGKYKIIRTAGWRNWLDAPDLRSGGH